MRRSRTGSRRSRPCSTLPARAYRRAAELIRETKAPIADLVQAGRARELRGIGPGIEARLRELVKTGGACASQRLKAVLDRFEALPQIVAVVEREPRRALGVTVEGVRTSSIWMLPSTWRSRRGRRSK
jgi:hypothetical protein